MSDDDLQELGRHGFAVAYRMLGSVADAEDLAQEALLRLSRAPVQPDEPAAWITTVTTRLAIDHLRLARVRRERYVGPWLPEPLLEDPEPGPAARAELADTLSQAFLVVLEQLTPPERAAFLLREVFGYDYAQLAAILDRSEAACRQLVTRARRHLEAGRPRFEADPQDHDELLQRFLRAADEGDVGGLEELLAEDAVLIADGGGKVTAARRPVEGREKVARFFVRVTARLRAEGRFTVEPVRVNGLPGRVLRDADGRVHDVLALEIADGRIQRLLIVRNPDKLAHL